MMHSDPASESPTSASVDIRSGDERYAAWFHDLDAWTEYWDIFHPETRGRYYFGDGESETGLLTRFLPRTGYPPAWRSWTRMALLTHSSSDFISEIRRPEVASAILEVDTLVARLFATHFGNARDVSVQDDYLEAIFRFAVDALPPATERSQRIPEGDWRKPTAGRHTLDGDLMWFAWSLQLEAARIILGENDEDHARRALLLAGVAKGCPANFAWRGHRRTRAVYRPDDATVQLLRERGRAWAKNFDDAAEEVHALFRIREWGEDNSIART